MTEDCPICFDAITVSTTGCVEMSCSHKFHLKCIGTWLSKNSSCPLCRNKPSELETLLRPEAPVVYRNGSRRIFEMTNSRTDRIMEYARFTINWNTSHTDYSSTEDQQTDSESVDLVPPDTDGIPGRDIRLVSQQTGMTDTQSLDALRRNNGDIVNSIMDLVNEL